MDTEIRTFIAAFNVLLAGLAMAQAPSGGGSSGGNLTNPGTLKNNRKKMDECITGSATGGAGYVPDAGRGPSADTTGAPVGSTGGNAVTGSDAAPSGDEDNCLKIGGSLCQQARKD